MDNFVADSIFIDAPAERVFRALVETAELAQWFEAERIEGPEKAEAGSEYVFHGEEGSTLEGEVDRYEPPYRLSLGDCFWEHGEIRRGPMSVEYTLEDHDDGVWLTVRQNDLDGQPGWKDYATAARAGWVRATVALKRYVEGI